MSKRKLDRPKYEEIPEFQSDRAVIHLYRREKKKLTKIEMKQEMERRVNEREEEDDEGPEVCREIDMNMEDMEILRPYLRRGDLLENIAVSGYRSSGVSIFDGEKVRCLGSRLDDYGCISSEYLVYKEFNPLYWYTDDLCTNNILVPGEYGRSCWHGGDYPCVYVDGDAILAHADGKITFQGVEYTIPEELIEFAKGNPKMNDRCECPPCDEYSNDVNVGVVFVLEKPVLK